VVRPWNSTYADATLLLRSNEKFGCAVLLVTHDVRILQACDRMVALRDGMIVPDPETEKG
jgi:lipoprotein-releasing system ATP-binding protein